MPWHHIPPANPRYVDLPCDKLGLFYRFFVTGDFDSDGLTEVVVAPAELGSAGNDLWVMKYNVAAGSWQHMAPIASHPKQADIDCSGQQFAAKFAVVADFDGDGADELVVAPDVGGSRGNDLWVMKFNRAAGIWQHMAPIPNHPMDADIDCSGQQFAAKFAVAGDFDGDGRAELAIAPAAGGSRGNDLWVMKYVGTFPRGTWQHMAPIPNHPMDADIDCSGQQFAAKFAVVADFDGDLIAELAIAPDTGTSRGNDFWVMKYTGTFPTGTWQHMAPIPNHPMDADIDCSGSQSPAKFAVAADFDRDGADELVVAPDGPPSLEEPFLFLWVKKYFGTFPGGAFDNMAGYVDVFLADTIFPPKSALVGAFDGQGPELVVGLDFYDVYPVGDAWFWVLAYDGE